MRSKIAYFLIVSFCCTAAAFSQNLRQESRIISQQKIKSRKTRCFLYNKDQADSIFYIAALVQYNEAGYPVWQTRYKEDGTITSKYQSKYKDDSLEIKGVRYGSDGDITNVTDFKYDDKGRILSRKDDDRVNEQGHASFFEWDTAAHASKTYFLRDGNKTLSGTHQFDKNWKLTRDDYVNAKGEPTSSYLQEYDSSGNNVRSYKVTGGNKVLITEKKYDNNNRLAEEINYYNSIVKYCDANGICINYKKGDKKKVTFQYDKNGLLFEQTERLNDKIILKVMYEYFY